MTLTGLHLRYQIHKRHMCFVGPSPLSSRIHAAQKRKSKKKAKKDGESNSSSSSSLPSNDIFQFYGVYQQVRPGTYTKTVGSHKLQRRVKSQSHKFSIDANSNANANSNAMPLSISAWDRLKKQNYPSLLPLTEELISPPVSSVYLGENQQQQIVQFKLMESDNGPTWGLEIPAEGHHDIFMFQDSHKVSGSVDVNGNVNEYPPTGEIGLLRPDSNTNANADAMTEDIDTDTSSTEDQEGGGISSSIEYISISCPMSTTLSSVPVRSPKRRNPNLVFLEECPATALLILLNVGLAFLYWNNRVDPSTVCKEYQKIIHEHELWRAFTGATAHFEPLHIGFNMMSLYTLGMDLEPTLYGSVPFLFYNICLIPLTTAIMMGMVWLQIRYKTRSRARGGTGGGIGSFSERGYDVEQQLRQTKSVGYSAVLFAWMVVSSLERSRTCPIPFMEDLCFETYSKYGFKFNFGPLVQLVLAQVIMPRVSFMGHLAGIVCGFLLHWNMLPREICYMPQVLIPAIVLFHFWYVRKIVSFRIDGFMSAGATTDTAGSMKLGNDNSPMVEMGGVGGNASRFRTSASVRNTSSLRKSEGKERTKQLQTWTQNVMIALMLMASSVFNVLGGVFWSQVLLTVLFVFATKGATQEIDTIWKAVFLTMVLVIVTDAIHIPYWIYLNTSIKGEWNVRSQIAVIFVAARLVGTSIALILASEAITESSSCGTIFDHTLGRIMRCCNSIASFPFFSGGGENNSGGGNTWGTFEGQGNVLGRA